MTALIQYELACAALAEATRIDQILPIHDEIAHVKLYAKQINNRELLIKASEFQMRVERKLGVVLAAAKEAGHIRQGRHVKRNGSDGEPFSVTLNEIGVDKKLSARAQKRADLPDDLFEAAITEAKSRIASEGAKIIDGEETISGSRAMMGSRIEPDHSLDFLPTPPWATRSLVETILPHLGINHIGPVWEPACGEGHMADVLAEYTGVLATDIKDYGYGDGVLDFLGEPNVFPVEWIITNPPFGDKAEQFTLRALEVATVGVAMFVPLRWLETIGRYQRLFVSQPPTLISFFVERVNLCKGEWRPKGSTATAYIWLVWVKGQTPQPPFWIPPNQRESLTHLDDAIRFTAHPVLRKSQSDDALASAMIPDASSAPASQSPSLSDAGAPIPGEIPGFLRKDQRDDERKPSESGV